VVCNEILGNYTIKEDQLMTTTFGSHEKWRFNRVMDALRFEYLDYPKLAKGADTGIKRKRIVSILEQEAIRSIEAKSLRRNWR
jgi:hypothetical protein